MLGVADIDTAKTTKHAKFGISGIGKHGNIRGANIAMEKGASTDRLGDRAAQTAFSNAVWFGDFTYIVSPYAGEVSGQMSWRKMRQDTFSIENRSIPLFLDSCGYRREITKTAPAWSYNIARYIEAIEMCKPDGYASWDYPADRLRSMSSLAQMMNIFPHDVTNGRMWPVFSIRWTWDNNAHLHYIPEWAGQSLSALVPLNETQKQLRRETRERYVRVAIANALVLAKDPDFSMMVEKFGRVMVGGMVGCDCPRPARHVFVATLCHLFPECQFWLLGQANFAVVNGLGKLGLLNRVSTDGTWWIWDAAAERFAYVKDGLITMQSFEGYGQTFFTMRELMAANLRSLLAAYEGLWTWPPPDPLPVNLIDTAQQVELKSRYYAAQLELGLGL